MGAHSGTSCCPARYCFHSSTIWCQGCSNLRLNSIGQLIFFRKSTVAVASMSLISAGVDLSAISMRKDFFSVSLLPQQLSLSTSKRMSPLQYLESILLYCKISRIAYSRLVRCVFVIISPRSPKETNWTPTIMSAIPRRKRGRLLIAVRPRSHSMER
jgi:hypothetical protein